MTIVLQTIQIGSPILTPLEKRPGRGTSGFHQAQFDVMFISAALLEYAKKKLVGALGNRDSAHRKWRNGALEHFLFFHMLRIS